MRMHDVAVVRVASAFQEVLLGLFWHFRVERAPKIHGRELPTQPAMLHQSPQTCMNHPLELCMLVHVRGTKCLSTVFIAAMTSCALLAHVSRRRQFKSL